MTFSLSSVVLLLGEISHAAYISSYVVVLPGSWTRYHAVGTPDVVRPSVWSSSSNRRSGRRAAPVDIRAYAANDDGSNDRSMPRESRWSMMSTRIDSAVDEEREGGEWTSLVDGATHGDDASSSPLRKLVLVRGANDDVIPRDGMRIQLRYTGTLYGTPPDTWSTNDVVESWLSEMQGMEGLMPSFVEYDIDGAKLTNLDEENCMDTMGLTRMQAKKLVMAIRRLVKQRDDHPSGTVFDSSDARDGGEYEFVLTPHDDDGKTSGGRIIRAMDVAVRTMRVGERSLVVCRSDYGYGSTGLRTNGGIVIVPPFATLCFDLTLVGATTIPS